MVKWSRVERHRKHNQPVLLAGLASASFAVAVWWLGGLHTEANAEQQVHPLCRSAFSATRGEPVPFDRSSVVTSRTPERPSFSTGGEMSLIWKFLPRENSISSS